jgi:hypothetical protein
MAGALWHHRVLDFPTPDTYPTWHSITRGTYGTFGSYYTYTPTTTATTTTTSAKTSGPAPDR